MAFFYGRMWGCLVLDKDCYLRAWLSIHQFLSGGLRPKLFGIVFATR